LSLTFGAGSHLHEVNTAAETIYEVVDPNANIIFGAVIDEKLQGELRITVIATDLQVKLKPPITPVRAVSKPNQAPTPLYASHHLLNPKTKLA